METTLAQRPNGAQEAQASALAGKYLAFALGQEEYGLPVLKVREIIKVMDITQVPQVAAHVRGVINLRGKVIPIIDLRLKFGFPAQDYTERTCIIVVDVSLSDRKSTRLNSSHLGISYAVFCLKKKRKNVIIHN